ncbi:hypothetical protein [Endozoicomonas sp. SCSIO W0465]|nr:hypothetical protein [Endozoicomonas sp. SCSIO W0465]
MSASSLVLVPADDAPVYNVRYCIDNDECQNCIDAFIEQQRGGVN